MPIFSSEYPNNTAPADDDVILTTDTSDAAAVKGVNFSAAESLFYSNFPDNIVTTNKLADASVTPVKISPSTLIARINGFIIGSDITNYTTELDDGNFSGGIWTAPQACIIQVSATLHFENQPSTAGGGAIDVRIRKNGVNKAALWGIGRASNSVDDVTASTSLAVVMAAGDTIRLYMGKAENVGTFGSDNSFLTITQLSGA